MLSISIHHVNSMKAKLKLNKTDYNTKFIVPNGPLGHKEPLFYPCFSLEARVGSQVKVARVARQRTSHVYIKPYLFTNYVQMTFVRTKLFPRNETLFIESQNYLETKLKYLRGACSLHQTRLYVLDKNIKTRRALVYKYKLNYSRL